MTTTQQRVLRVSEEGRVYTHDGCIEKAIQLEHTKRWVTVNRSYEQTPNTDGRIVSYRYLEEAVDALRAKHGVSPTAGSSTRRVVEA